MRGNECVCVSVGNVVGPFQAQQVQQLLQRQKQQAAVQQKAAQPQQTPVAVQQKVANTHTQSYNTFLHSYAVTLREVNKSLFQQFVILQINERAA